MPGKSEEMDIERALEILDWILEDSPELDLVRPLPQGLREKQEKLTRLREALQQFIHQEGVPLPESLDYVRDLLLYLHRVFGQGSPESESPSPVLIFTFNYDCAVEIAASQLGLPVDTGFAGRWRGFDESTDYPIRLHKLHGSVTWYQDQTTFWELPIKEEPHTTIWNQPLAPVMLYPGNKAALHREPFLTLHQAWRTALEHDLHTLVVIGYSFRNDKYVLDVVDEWVKRGRSPLDRHVLIVDPQLPSWQPTVNELACWSWLPLKAKALPAFLRQQGTGNLAHIVQPRDGALDQLRQFLASTSISSSLDNLEQNPFSPLVATVGMGFFGAAWYFLDEIARKFGASGVQRVLGADFDPNEPNGASTINVYHIAALLASADRYRPEENLLRAVFQAFRNVLALGRHCVFNESNEWQTPQVSMPWVVQTDPPRIWPYIKEYVQPNREPWRNGINDLLTILPSWIQVFAETSVPRTKLSPESTAHYQTLLQIASQRNWSLTPQAITTPYGNNNNIISGITLEDLVRPLLEILEDALSNATGEPPSLDSKQQSTS